MAQAFALETPPSPLPSPGGLDAVSKRAFLRSISHELRTPLNSIIGFAELLGQQPCGPLGPEYLDYASIIGASGHKMLKLVNQIVEIVRLESHATEFDIAPEPLESLVEEVLASLQAEAGALGVRLQAEAAEQMPWVLADARALKTALGNLLQNAIAHTAEGDTVIVRASRAGQAVSIEVQDPGPGADAADAARLLRPFEKGKPGLSRTGDGHGLGLPIALLLCRAMCGDLAIRTAPGEGFTALVMLPAA